MTMTASWDALEIAMMAEGERESERIDLCVSLRGRLGAHTKCREGQTQRLPDHSFRLGRNEAYIFARVPRRRMSGFADRLSLPCGMLGGSSVSNFLSESREIFISESKVWKRTMTVHVRRDAALR